MSQLHCRPKQRNHRDRLRATSAKNREQLLSAVATVRAELVGSNRATAQTLTVTSATPVLALCRALLASGVDPSTSLDVHRNNILCVRITSIGQAAQLEPSPRGIGFVRRHSRLRAAPPVRETVPVKGSPPPALSRAPKQGASHRPSERPLSASSHARSTRKDRPQ